MRKISRSRQRMTAQAHDWLARVLAQGSRALDATAGNGHDTLFLVNAVMPSGKVWFVDAQECALSATTERLKAAGLENYVRSREVMGLCAYHQNLETALSSAGLPPEPLLDAAIFNLGYLPGGDKTFVTRADSTLAALEAVLPRLKRGGRLAVVAYVGHPGGEAEAQAVATWCESKSQAGLLWQDNANLAAEQFPSKAPRGYFCEKR